MLLQHVELKSEKRQTQSMPFIVQFGTNYLTPASACIMMQGMNCF